MKAEKNKENYLDKKPRINPELKWECNEDGVVLHLENRGAVKFITQKLFKKPHTSHIHLDEMGNFIWKRLNGEKTLYEIAQDVYNEFLENSEPLYERLTAYINMLISYNFVLLN